MFEKEKRLTLNLLKAGVFSFSLWIQRQKHPPVSPVIKLGLIRQVKPVLGPKSINVPVLHSAVCSLRFYWVRNFIHVLNTPHEIFLPLICPSILWPYVILSLGDKAVPKLKTMINHLEESVLVVIINRTITYITYRYTWNNWHDWCTEWFSNKHKYPLQCFGV